MDWFTRLTGFRETSYAETQARLEVNGSTLRSTVNGKSYGIGQFEMPSLGELRQQVAAGSGQTGRLRVSILTGDVRQMHQRPEFSGALFQVASQFNFLEMVGPSVSPEDGVTRYEHDRTQGPACAMAAGAATIYRNYLVPVGEHTGQTADRQLDGLRDLGDHLSRVLGCEVSNLWDMRNGYALASLRGLKLISDHLGQISAQQRDELGGLLRIGLHKDVEVTDSPNLPGPLGSQAFCSALPVAYGRAPQHHWETFARLILNAAYEATLLAGVLNARCGKSNIVLLTSLGGGAFGNAPLWIQDAMAQALDLMSGHDLDVRLVSYGPPTSSMRALVR
jgi:hypothetical protein